MINSLLNKIRKYRLYYLLRHNRVENVREFITNTFRLRRTSGPGINPVDCPE